MKKLTNSARRCFNACHRKYQYRYILGRVPRIESEALRFGSLMHLGLEAWWKGTKESRLQDATQALTESQADDMTIATASALMAGYELMWGSCEYETLAVEIEYSVPLVNPETLTQSRTWELAGKLDNVAKINRSANIFEHKTTSDSIDIDSDYWRRLTIDGQVSGYYLGARSIGFDVVNCIYDVIKKPSMRPFKATPEDARKYTKDGKLYATQHDEDETMLQWHRRLLDDVQANLPKYFARKNVVRLEADMEEYLSDMWAVGREIAEAERLGRWARNPDSCTGYGTCEYFSVCCNESSIEDENLFKTEQNKNRELSNGI